MMAYRSTAEQHVSTEQTVNKKRSLLGSHTVSSCTYRVCIENICAWLWLCPYVIFLDMYSIQYSGCCMCYIQHDLPVSSGP